MSNHRVSTKFISNIYVFDFYYDYSKDMPSKFCKFFVSNLKNVFFSIRFNLNLSKTL